MWNIKHPPGQVFNKSGVCFNFNLDHEGLVPGNGHPVFSVQFMFCFRVLGTISNIRDGFILVLWSSWARCCQKSYKSLANLQIIIVMVVSILWFNYHMDIFPLPLIFSRSIISHPGKNGIDNTSGLLFKENYHFYFFIFFFAFPIVFLFKNFYFYYLLTWNIILILKSVWIHIWLFLSKYSVIWLAFQFFFSTHIILYTVIWYWNLNWFVIPYVKVLIDGHD